LYFGFISDVTTALDIDVTIAVVRGDEQDYWSASWEDYKLAFYPYVIGG